MSTQDVDKYLSQIEREGLQRGMQKGLQRGMQKGLQKGRKEGRDEGFAAAVLGAYRARFGAAPATVVSAVNGARDRAHLQRLLKIVTTLSQEEVAAAVRASRKSPSKRGATPAKRSRAAAGTSPGVKAGKRSSTTPRRGAPRKRAAATS